MITSGDLHLCIFIPVLTYNCADLHLCGFTPVRMYTCADLHLCGFIPARIYKPRGKTPALNYKPRGFTPTAEKHLRGKTTTADLQATRIYTYLGKTPVRFSSMTVCGTGRLREILDTFHLFWVGFDAFCPEHISRKYKFLRDLELLFGYCYIQLLATFQYLYDTLFQSVQITRPD